MISFKQFIYEGRDYEKVDVQDDGAALKELFRGRFSDSVGFLRSNTLYRGTSWTGTRIIKAADKDRSAKSGGEYYTALLDSNPRNAGWPSRKRSTFVTNNKNFAHSFGDTHLVFPANGTEIAVLNVYDMWMVKIDSKAADAWVSRITSSHIGATLRSISLALEYEGVKQEGLTVQNLVSRMGEDEYKEAFGDLTPEKLFSYKFLGAELKTIHELQNTELLMGGNEMWFEGECLLVPTEFEGMLRRLLTEEGIL